MTDQKDDSATPRLRHLAIIMDGNGRWAKQRNLPRIMGHRQGMEAVRRTVEAAQEFGLTHVTLFSFSTENWKRPTDEVRDLLGLMRQFIQSDIKKLKAKNVRVRIIGDRETLSPELQELVSYSERETEMNTGLTLAIAFNYGSRDEQTRAARRLAQDVADGKITPQDVTEDALAARLDTADMPDPDAILRTSGELRISNFLLWQAAYAEFFFLDIYWPEFGREQMSQVIEAFGRRDRRFGDTHSRAVG